MSYSLIKEGLQKVNEVSSWKSLLISYDHKTYPNEFTCYIMNFSTSKLLKDVINNMCKTYLYKVNNFEGKVQEYTGFNSKNTIDKISTNSDLISESWNSLIQHINAYDDTTKLKEIEANAFIFVGTYLNENGEHKNLYLLTRKNPIINLEKDRNRSTIFTSQHNTITEATDPLVQFSKCFDALIYNNTAYMINSNCESVFNMEYSHKKICHRCLDELESTNLIKDIDSYRQFATSGQTPKKFITYDKVIVDKLKEPKNQKKLSNYLKIPYNSSTKQFDLSNAEHSKNFTLAICGKTKFNMFDDGLCEVPSSIPLRVS